METTDPCAHEPAARRTAEERSELNISPVPATPIELQDAHWLRMDPSLTRAVLAKTEEDLLGGLAALMRNKVEYEQVSRRLAQVQIDTAQAKHELDAINQQIRRAEEEVATRINEHSRIAGEIADARQELSTVRGEYRQRLEAASGLKNKVGEAQRLLAEAQQFLGTVKDETAARLAEHQEVTSRLDQIKSEKAVLENEVARLQTEANDRIRAREVLLQEIVPLETHRPDLATPREKIEATEKEKAVPAREEDLPLLFGSESRPVADDWDSYLLESEFHTDEELDAKKVAALVAQLPGLEGCLIVRNHGPVLAAQLPERIQSRLKVPHRDYNFIFERLQKKIDEFNLPHGRLATFDLGDEGLTVAQASHAFVIVNHRQTKLRPGVPDKLASIVTEVAKMYP